jgi:lipid-binding SYLF domain-containing protein
MTSRLLRLSLVAGLSAAIALPAPYAVAATAGELNRDGRAALNRLLALQPAAKLLAPKAKAVLVFPKMVKAGFMFGGQIGEGVLLKNGKPVGYYNSVSASYGLQAGIQSFSYALFFMTNDALSRLDQTGGFEVGVGPSVVIVDEGVAKTLTTTTVASDVYAFIFGQQGLMAGLGLQGTKITKIAK